MTLCPADLWLYAGAMLVLFLTPGPVWLALMARGLSGGFHAAWPLAVGVALGDMIWPLVAVLGVSWIVSTIDGVMLVLKWIAVAMFAMMGLLLIRNADHRITPDSRLTRPGLWSGFLAGVLVILSNPKAILFYMGVLPGFFDLSGVTSEDVSAIVAISFLVPFLGNLTLAAFIGQARHWLTSPTALRRVNTTSGLLLIIVGILIATT